MGTRYRLLLLVLTFCAVLLAVWFAPSWLARLGNAPSTFAVVRFKDVTQSNVSSDVPLRELVFVDLDGRDVRIRDYEGKKHVVLVVTRGYSGQICLYCSTQTSRLLANYDALVQRDAELVVVFPISVVEDKEHVHDLIAAAKRELDRPPERIPFPLVFDVQLAAVDRLGIRQELAKPATYILDKSGRVRFAYVGTSISDRPSLQSIFDQLDAIRSGDTAGSASAD